MAQGNTQDSLLKLLSKAKEDTNKVRLLLHLSNDIINNEPIAATNYAISAEALSKRLSFNNGIFSALTNVGQSYYIRGIYDSSEIIFKESLELANKMGDKLKTGMAQVNLGSLMREKGDFEKSLEYYIAGRKEIEKSTDQLLLAELDDALQILYYTRGDYDKGILHGEKARAIARNSKNKVFLARCLTNLSLNYYYKKKLPEAELLLNESLAIAREIKDKRIEATALLNLSELALKSLNVAKVKKYCRQSLKLSREIGSSDIEALALRAIATAFLRESDLDSAKLYALQSYRIDTAKQLRRETIEVLDLLSHIHFASGKINEGFKYNRLFGEGVEEYIADMFSKQSAELEGKYQTEKKQSQIAALESQTLVQEFSIRQKSTLNYILAVGTAAILIISLLSYRGYKHKQKLQQQKIDALETAKQLTATEAILKGEEQERSRLAKDLHDGLGGMMSGIKYSLLTMKKNQIMTPENQQAFERSIDMLDSSINEMRRVAHNMMPEALVKFGLDTALNDFCSEVNQTGALQVSYQSIGIKEEQFEQITAITIYRIVQELVNNTMKHAAARSAIVQVSKTNGVVSITVEDDGKGFNTAILDQVKGIGWNNIQSRVDYLKGKLDVRSDPGKGTSVHIELTV